MTRFYSVLLAAIALIGVAAFSPSFGQTIDLKGLTPDQVKELSEKAKSFKDEAKQAPAVVQKISEGTREELGKWAELGSGMGKAMIATAKEMGMAANEFAGTNLGKVVIFIVAFKIIGKSILGIIFGSVVMTVGYHVAYRFLRPVDWAKYEHIPVLWGMFTWKRTVEKKLARIDGEDLVGRYIGSMIIFIGSTIVASISIFS